jgi:anthranilate synthase component II
MLLLDNYDSFTYNLFHYLEGEGEDVVVRRNDEISIEEAMQFDKIVLSPGPGLPKDSGIMPELLKRLPDTTKVLGVCLGLQAIVECYGGRLTNLETVIHGQSSLAHCEDDLDILFKDIKSPFQIGHYHSWVASELGADLIVTSRNESGLIMSIRHKTKPIHAVQFHPESILTPEGRKMIHNWVTTNDR